MIKIINKSLFLLVFCFCFFVVIETSQAATCTWRSSVYTLPTETGTTQMGDIERTSGGLVGGCQENEEVKSDDYCSAGTKPTASTGEIITCCCEIENEVVEDKTGFIPQITIPGSDFIKGQTVKMSPSTKTLADYIKAIYNYMLAVVGLLAAVVIMIGGVIWLTAAGNTERISQAKSWISGSLVGLVLALTSFLLLRIINPNLVDFKITEIKTIRPIESGCCVSEKSQDKAFMTTSDGCYETLLSNGEAAIVSNDDLDEKYEGSLAKYLTGKFFAGDYVVKDGSCHLLTEEEKTINEKACKGKGIGDDWGESCEEYAGCYCFNEKYYDDFGGKENEPCGNDSGSRCVPSGRCSNNRDFGGRSCDTSLKCCEISGIKTSDNSICKGVQNAQKCTNNEKDCWCYDNIVWRGNGASSTPCGKKPGAVCMPDSCDDGYSWDRSGGTRSCISSHFCCAPN